MAEHSRRAGFTLVELLVVVAIIALLLSILLPSLASARTQAKSVKCGANTRSVSQGLATHLSQNNGLFPPAYLYPDNPNGYVNMETLDNQDPNKTNGYLHWSWFIYGAAEAADESAFQCPTMDRGGTTPTNPGSGDCNAWEINQRDDGTSDCGTAIISDKQAKRMAFAANAAVMPRNKFTAEMNYGGARFNQLVSDSTIHNPSRTISLAELNNNVKTTFIIHPNDHQYYLSKSHRPLMPFFHVGYGGQNYEYGIPVGTSGFIYTTTDEALLPEPQKTYHLLAPEKLADLTTDEALGILDGSSTLSQLNAVGRHHPGGNQRWGGTGYFVYVDGHVELKNIWDTLSNREWGQTYYSLTGERNSTDVLDANIFN